MGKCRYCGRDMADDQAHCSDCGTPTPETEASAAKPKKSKPWAIGFALVFGPLGLLYLGFEGFFVIAFVFGLTLFLLPLLIVLKAGIWVNIFARIGCAAYAAQAVDERNGTKSIQAEANEYLNEAAELENNDMDAAIAKYEEVIRRFPDTSAGKEAERNIETIQKNRAQPEN